MAILKNCELWFLRADPKRPNAKFSPDNPTWEVQIRTTSKETRAEWQAMGLSVKSVVPDEGDPYFRVNLKKKSIKAVDGEPATPVRVVDGSLQPLDPNTVGNGSVGNVRIFQYEYKNKAKAGVASVLMGIQVTKHVVFSPKTHDEEFDACETEVIDPDAGSEDFESENDDDVF